MSVNDATACQPLAKGRDDPPAGPEWRASARGFIVDLDGTLLRGGQLTDGAAALVDHLEPRCVLASNNSSHTAPLLAGELNRLFLHVAPKDLVLAGELTIELLARERPDDRFLLFSTSAIRRLALDVGLNLVERDPDVVVLARDPLFDYSGLARAANALRDGACLIVTNPDSSHPGAGDELVPETGSLMEAVTAVSGVVPHQIVGKPSPCLFREALRRLGTSTDETLVIGDNPRTDAAGAVALGMRYLLIGGEAESAFPSPRSLLAFSGPARETMAEDPASLLRPIRNA